MTQRRCVLSQLSLVVRDMEKSAAFYQRLGLEFGDLGPAWNAHHRSAQQPRDSGAADFDLDSNAYAQQWNAGCGPERTGPVIGFRLQTPDDVDSLYAELIAAGHKSQQEPYDTFWGARYAIVEDPDGNPVGLMSPSDPDRRTRPTLPTLRQP